MHNIPVYKAWYHAVLFSAILSFSFVAVLTLLCTEFKSYTGCLATMLPMYANCYKSSILFDLNKYCINYNAILNWSCFVHSGLFHCFKYSMLKIIH